MIHGDEDQTASPEAARRFAQTFGARLIQVPGRGPQPVRPRHAPAGGPGGPGFYLAP